MINLIYDPWIPVIRLNGKAEHIAPWQIAEQDNPVIDINAPRADFKSGIYQFLIGLIQVAFAPNNEDDWEEQFTSELDSEAFKAALAPFAGGFNLYNPEGIAFLQDYDLPDGEVKDIAALLIETPGGKTVKDNLDHFIKRGQHQKMCPSCAAAALFTLQANAPSGGVGHRVGLRGGGPITSFVTLNDKKNSLWKNLWLNVLSQEEFGESEFSLNADVFPWLALTRTSEKKDGITRPVDVDGLQAYWGMPRRIRLEAPIKQQGYCDTCGKAGDVFFSHFCTKNYGVNYGGVWIHPLTAYKFDPKGEKEPLSLKGQQGGMSYRNWLSQVLHDDEGSKSAKVVHVANERLRNLDDDIGISLWCSGYDMDNMKARCWYEDHLPLFNLSTEQRQNVQQWTQAMISCATASVSLLRTYVKQAWANRPGDLKTDLQQVMGAFWQHSQPDFYRLLNQLAKLPAEARFPFEVYEDWLRVLFKVVMTRFDEAVLSFDVQDRYLQRAIIAKEALKKKFATHKDIKDMKKLIVNNKKQEEV